jgi:hypothetical protein
MTMPVSAQDLDRVHDFIQGLRDAHDESFKRLVKAQTIAIVGTGAYLAYRKFGKGAR